MNVCPVKVLDVPITRAEYYELESVHALNESWVIHQLFNVLCGLSVDSRVTTTIQLSLQKAATLMGPHRPREITAVTVGKGQFKVYFL